MLDTLQHWARVLRIPHELPWFRMPEDTGLPPTSAAARPVAQPAGKATDDPAHEPVLVAPCNHRGTVASVVVLSGGDRMKRRAFLSPDRPGVDRPGTPVADPRTRTTPLRTVRTADLGKADRPADRDDHRTARWTTWAAAAVCSPWLVGLRIETALAGTRGQATPALLAQLHSQQAYAFAILHDTSACTAAFSQARIQVEQLQPDDDPYWLYWTGPSLIAIRTGDCLLELGQHDQAVTLFRQGLSQLNQSFVRDQQIYTTQLADTLARPGKQRDLDAAAGLGMQALDLAESLDSSRGTGRLRDPYYLLKPHHQTPAVRDFLERAEGLVEA